MLLNSKGQVTIPADLRTKHRLHEGEEIGVIEVDGVLTIVRAENAENAESRGHRMVRRLRGSGTDAATDGMSTGELMELLRGE